jgi:hypothetical protein
LSSLIFAVAEICLECFAVHEPKSEFILFESFWSSFLNPSGLASRELQSSGFFLFLSNLRPDLLKSYFFL